jgi:hypothetical protein
VRSKSPIRWQLCDYCCSHCVRLHRVGLEVMEEERANSVGNGDNTIVNRPAVTVVAAAPAGQIRDSTALSCPRCVEAVPQASGITHPRLPLFTTKIPTIASLCTAMMVTKRPPLSPAKLSCCNHHSTIHDFSPWRPWSCCTTFQLNKMTQDPSWTKYLAVVEGPSLRRRWRYCGVALCC